MGEQASAFEDLFYIWGIPMLNWKNICWSISQNRPGEALEQVNEELARLQDENEYVETFPFFKDSEEAVAVLRALRPGLGGFASQEEAAQ